MCFGISNQSLHMISTVLLNLEFLDVVYCRKISDDGLALLYNLQNLKRLRLYGHHDQITDKGLAMIGKVSSLLRLEMPGLGVVTANGVKSLLNLPNLQHLSMERASIADDAMQFLGNMMSLRTLLIPKCQNLTSGGILFLKSLSPLSTLNISSCGIDDRAVEHLKAGNLREIYFAGTFITDFGLDSLYGNPLLTKLSLGSCSLITTSGILRLKLPNLEHLNLSFNEQILDSGFQNITENCPSLRELLLSKCKKFSNVGLELVAKLPKISVVDITFCSVTKEGIESFQRQKPQTELVVTKLVKASINRDRGERV